MSKQIIKTDKAPAPIGPYNQAVKANGMLFVSGQVAFVPETGELVSSSVADETHQVMKNLQAVLSEAKLTFAHVVKTSIFLSDMSLFAQVMDIAMKLGTNYPFGPFEWSEKIGLGRIHALLSKLSETSTRYQIAPALTKEIS